MDILFWFKIGLSFLIGGAWVSLSTLAAEKFGSRVGGILAGFPSTAAIALFFIGLTQSAEIASAATTVMPMTHGVNGLFLVIYILLIRRGLFLSLLAALSVWFLNAFILSAIGIRHFELSILVWAFLFLFSFFMTEKVMTIRSTGSIRLKYSARQALLRGLFGGSVIASAVLIGKLGGPTMGGIFAIFPSIFVSTLAVTYLSGGADFSKAVAKSMLFSGLINVTLYAIVVRYLFLHVGLYWGTMIGLVFSMGIGFLTYVIMTKRLS
jgi:hypothetical protein